MNEQQRKEVKARILKRYELYKFQSSRLKRLLKDPLRTLPYYIMQFIAYRVPFKVNYKTFWGDKMSFYLPEGNAIYYYGFFEANLANFFINFLKRGDVFIDVGAHVGYYTLLARALVEESGQVHSFEPTPRTFRTLQGNVSGKTGVYVNNHALLNKKTTIEFVDYGPKYSAFNSYKTRTGQQMSFLPTPEKMMVDTVFLDDYCREKQVTPTIIKIDAEGAEHLILQAMTNTLQKAKPVVTIEVAGNDEWKENCHQSISLLKHQGYESYEITNEGFLKPHTEKESYSYDNLVFVHQDNRHSVQSLLL